jgi:cold shock CspA family protein
MVDRAEDVMANDREMQLAEPFSGHTPGDEFLARLDMSVARDRMRALLVEPDEMECASEDARLAADKYVALQDSWDVQQHDDHRDQNYPDGVDSADNLVALEQGRLSSRALRLPLTLQAFREVNVENGTATSELESGSLPEADREWQLAMVRWFNPARGVGYLSTGPNSPDVFVHMETLRRLGFDELRPGQLVEIRCDERGGQNTVVGLRLLPLGKVTRCD